MPPREPELYKDKVEVSLDGRQIFYLFFGGAVIVGIVFVLGVLVGRRVEARGHVDRAKTHAATDPLAALDRLEGDGKISFRASLTGKEQGTEVEKEIERRAAAKAAPSKTEEPKAKTEEKSAKAEEPKAKSEEKSKSEDKKSEDKKSEDKKADEKVKTEEKSAKTEEPKAKSEEREKAKSEEKSAKAEDKAKTEETKKSEKTDEAKKTDEPKSKFTLQLSSFQDKEEAEAFLSSVKSQGYQARMTQADVEGKGTFYRVRMGSYSSMDAANEAKSDFEKNAKKSASVMKL